MPLSKERNRERMRKSRLHKATSVPQGMEAVQPNQVMPGFIKRHSNSYTVIDPITLDYPQLDADGNVIPEVN